MRTRRIDRETGHANAATPTLDSDRNAIGVEHPSPEEVCSALYKLKIFYFYI